MKSELIESIQTSGVKACMVLSGGGISAAQQILGHGGASRFVLDVQVPYIQKAFDNYLRFKPESYCSVETAMDLSIQAYENALALTGDEDVIGIACTAGIATNRVRRGEDRAFVSVTGKYGNVVAKLECTTEGREAQEQEVGEFVLELVAKFVGVL